MGWLRLGRRQRYRTQSQVPFIGNHDGSRKKGQGAEEISRDFSSRQGYRISEDNVNSGSTLKTILFWLSIVLLGVMLWKLVSANGAQAREEEPSYSLLMAKIDANEIKEVTMYLSPNSYELQGEYAKPPNQKFRAIIAKENAPEVTKALRDKAVQVKVKEVRSGDWVLILLNAAPLILLVGFCLTWTALSRRAL